MVAFVVTKTHSQLGCQSMSTDEQLRLQPADPAPPFCLKDTDGNDVCLTSYLGKRVVLYFYPKDLTPGCTTQACEYNSIYHTLRQMGVELLGVSPDPQSSHERFRSRYELEFKLLSDPDKLVLKAYGAFGEKKNYGKIYEGVIRSSFVISPEGKIEAAFYNVRAKGNAQRVLDYIASHPL